MYNKQLKMVHELKGWVTIINKINKINNKYQLDLQIPLKPYNIY